MWLKKKKASKLDFPNQFIQPPKAPWNEAVSQDFLKTECEGAPPLPFWESLPKDWSYHRKSLQLDSYQMDNPPQQEFGLENTTGGGNLLEDGVQQESWGMKGFKSNSQHFELSQDANS